jgi:flavin-dependent dehydrogenase
LSWRDSGRYDVAIVGAGPAGAACGLALARAGAGRVALIEAPPPRGPVAAVGETLPPDARFLLDRLGLWEAFLAENHSPCLGSCSAWGSPVLGHNDFLLNPNGSGWHLDRARFDFFLRREALAAGCEPVAGRLSGVADAADEGWRLRLAVPDGNAELRARFVVDASGRASAFARLAGAVQQGLDRLTFVYGYFDSSAAVSRSRLTLLEAVEHGWWYAAELPGDRLAVAFAGDAERIREKGLGRDAAWLGSALATRHLAPRLNNCRFLAGSLVPRVAAGFLLDRVAGPDWLAIGDSAACYDPLSAQGLYKALADGLGGAGAIAAALKAGGPIPPAYAEAARLGFEEYLVNRNHFYGLERRWPDSPFWRSRQSRVALRAAA